MGIEIHAEDNRNVRSPTKLDDSFSPTPPGRLDEFLRDPNILAPIALFQAPFAIIVCDEHLNIRLVSDLARTISKSRPEGQSMRSACIIWGEIVDSNGCSMEWPCSKGLPTQVVMAEDRELISDDGSTRHLLIGAAPMILPGGTTVGAVVILADISHHKNQEFVRQDCALTRERTRIAENIHDNVSQDLNAAVLQIRAARKELADSVRLTRTRLGNALKLGLHSLEEARLATSMLSYEFAMNDDTAFVLTNIASQLFSESNVSLEFALEKPVPPLPSRLHRELLRIGKEALTNACKHANASMVMISLACDKNNAELKVTDNGCGFVQTSLFVLHEGFGLPSMRARAKRMGGKLDIDSQLGHGTSVTALLPLAARRWVAE